ncbi:MAG TPA: flagellar hook-associated protein FlgK [Rhodocyclaceae bacterium]|nr:flagellar hook-associated protein FlgK [Rhodocyclaceae bacterium]
MSSLLDIGLTGLNAAQAALLTTSHNIANANVDGFTRQQIVQTTQQPMFTGEGFFGSGTKVETVKRIYSQYLENQVMSADTTHSQLDTYNTQVSQIDNLLGDTTVGLTPALQSFFDGVQQVAANPASVPSRQAMLSNAQSLATSFQTIAQRLTEIQDGVEGQISSSVTNINSYAAQIAALNKSIITSQVAGPTQPANDLMDQRGELVEQLNREVGVTTITQDDGSVNVFIGNGQPLVVGINSYTVTATPSVDDGQSLSVGLKLPTGNSVQIPDSLISGGNLGGLLQFRADALRPAQDALGRVAVGITETFNAQHKLGQDLDGVMGGNFFTPLTPTVQNLPDPTTGIPPAATLSGSYTSVANLTNEDYILAYDGTNYSLTRQSDNSVVYSGATLPTNVDGFSLSVASGTVAAGDRFLIQPTRFAAQNVQVAIQDTRLIAAGAPFTTAAASSNTGTSSISQGSVVSSTGIASTPPHMGNITLTFDAGTNLFTLGGAAAGTLAYNPVSDSAGKTFTLASPNISFTIGGTPNTGDVFNIASNDSGVSDNRNAVALGGLQSVKTLLGGSASFQSAYSQLVSDVGSQTRQSEVGVSSQEGLLTQAKASQQSLSGVNLDEEASNLLRFQQAYQASAKVMSIADKLFDAVLSIAG